MTIVKGREIRTMGDQCEIAIEYLNETNSWSLFNGLAFLGTRVNPGPFKTGKEFFDAHPKGELMHVFVIYDAALAYYTEKGLVKSA